MQTLKLQQNGLGSLRPCLLRSSNVHLNTLSTLDLEAETLRLHGPRLMNLAIMISYPLAPDYRAMALERTESGEIAPHTRRTRFLLGHLLLCLPEEVKLSADHSTADNVPVKPPTRFLWARARSEGG